ncbi:hypothetical protein [Spiroplasma tabanidicola]|uniref:Uncharacterized protein n=1 Tax=Spiroplasma tabanidicola TaxID=324079 RepID=A0A6I6CA54_9MOLU|nr:hypothetical protein [Spiroplasma tabanidicola]QGS51825.1 hypothetical protein STABA_v1c04620 [Spiroplasma tabanidicola]
MKKLIKLIFGISLTTVISSTVVSCSHKIKLSENDIKNMINEEYSKSDMYYRSMEDVNNVLSNIFMKYNNYIQLNSVGNPNQEGYLIKANKIEETTAKISFSITAQKIEKVGSEFIVNDDFFYNQTYKTFKWIDKLSVDNDKFQTDFYNKTVSIKILNFEDLDGISYKIVDGKEWVEKSDFDSINKNIFNITIIPNLESYQSNRIIRFLFKAKNAKEYTNIEIENVIKTYDPIIETDIKNNEITTKWGNKIEFNILDYAKYKNLKVAPTSYSNSLIEDFVINNGKVTTTMLYRNDEYNTFFQSSYFWLNIMADDIPSPTKIKIIANPIDTPFVNNNNESNINLNVSKENEILFDKKIKNKKLHFKEDDAKKYLLFKNGNVESNGVDYSGLDKMIIEGWVFDKSKNYIWCNLSFDKEFILLNNSIVTKNLVYNFFFILKEYKINDIKINDQNTIIQSNDDNDLNYEINNNIVDVYTKADNFYLKIKTEEFRKFNSIIEEFSDDDTDIKLEYTFDIYQYYKEYCDIKISYFSYLDEKLISTKLKFGYNQYDLNFKVHLS